MKECFVRSVSGNISIQTDKNGEKQKCENLVTVSDDINLVFDHGGKYTLTVNSVSGNIKIENLVGNDIKIKSTSGDITITECFIKNLVVSSTSGKFVVKNCVIDRLSLRNNSRKIKCKNILVNCGTIQSNSGDIEYENIACSDNLFIQTNSGNIKGDYTVAKEYTIKSSSGDIELLRTPLSSSYSAISSISGEVTVETDENADISPIGKRVYVRRRSIK